jgi:hypothetical protein
VLYKCPPIALLSSATSEFRQCDAPLLEREQRRSDKHPLHDPRADRALVSKRGFRRILFPPKWSEPEPNSIHARTTDTIRPETQSLPPRQSAFTSWRTTLSSSPESCVGHTAKLTEKRRGSQIATSALITPAITLIALSCWSSSACPRI